MRRLLLLLRLFFSRELVTRGLYGQQFRQRLQAAASEWTEAECAWLKGSMERGAENHTRYCRAWDDLRRAAIEYAIYDGTPHAVPWHGPLTKSAREARSAKA